jgi:hypothetical protein
MLSILVQNRPKSHQLKPPVNAVVTDNLDENLYSLSCFLWLHNSVTYIIFALKLSVLDMQPSAVSTVQKVFIFSHITVCSRVPLYPILFPFLCPAYRIPSINLKLTSSITYCLLPCPMIGNIGARLTQSTDWICVT